MHKFNISTRCLTEDFQKFHREHNFHMYGFSYAFSNELSKVVSYYTSYKEIICQPHMILLQHKMYKITTIILYHLCGLSYAFSY